MHCLPAVIGVAAAAWFPCQARAQGGFNGAGRYEISNVRSGKVLDLDRHTRRDVMQFSTRNTDSRQWDILPAPVAGYWIIRNVMNGAALEARDSRNRTPVRGTPFTGSPSQQWRITPAGDGYALIVDRMGRTLDIPNSAASDGVRVQTHEVNGESSQRFMFRRLADLAPPMDGGRDRWGIQGNGACFYRQPGYRGPSFCVRAGEELGRLPDDLSERFRSLKVFGRVRSVEVFAEEEFAGRRVRFESDQPEIRDLRRIVSVRVD